VFLRMRYATTRLLARNLCILIISLKTVFGEINSRFLGVPFKVQFHISLCFIDGIGNELGRPCADYRINAPICHPIQNGSLQNQPLPRTPLTSCPQTRQLRHGRQQVRVRQPFQHLPVVRRRDVKDD